MNALREALPDSIGWWVAGLVMLCWFVGAYNRIVRLRSAALQAWVVLQAAVQRQMDFVQLHLAVPDAAQAIGAADVEVDDSHAARAERARSAARVASAQAALAQLSTLLASTRARPLHAPGMAALGTALQVLVATWQGMYPDVAPAALATHPASRPAPLEPQAAPAEEASAIAWPDPSAGTDVARHQFNFAVMQYNRAIRQFPALLVAWIMQLRSAAPLR